MLLSMITLLDILGVFYYLHIKFLLFTCMVTRQTSRNYLRTSIVGICAVGWFA